jgi:hypothetical protein
MRSTKGKKLKPAKKKKRTKLVTPNGKSQTPLAKRSRFGRDTGVQSEEDSGTSEVANTKEARMPGVKTGSNGNVARNKMVKKVTGYKSANSVKDTGDETTSLNVAKLNVAKLSGRERNTLLRQFHDDDDNDSIPDSLFPGWV